MGRMTSHLYIYIYIFIYEMENKIPWFQTTNQLALFDVKSIGCENGHGYGGVDQYVGLGYGAWHPDGLTGQIRFKENSNHITAYKELPFLHFSWGLPLE